MSVTVDPTGQFAYVANCGAGAGICGGAGTGTVSAYTINGTTGELTSVPGSPFAAGVLSLSVTVDPTGQFAYVANCGDFCVFDGNGNVSGYAIDATTGALTEILGPPPSPFPAGRGPSSVTVDPTGRFAYVANAGSGNVSGYTIDGATGALMEILGSPFPAGSVPRSVTTTAGPRLAP